MMNYKIKDICNVEKGKTPIKKAIPGEYPLVVTAEERLSTDEFQFDTDAVCIPLVSSTGHGDASIKRLQYQSGKFALGNILCAVYSKDETIVLTRFLYIYLSFYKDDLLVPLMKGTANVSLSTEAIKKLEIDIPSMEEQRKIVQKFDLLEDKINVLNKIRDNYINSCYKLKQMILNNFFENKPTYKMDEIFNVCKGSLQSSKCEYGEYDFITASSEWKKHSSYTNEEEALIYAVGAEGSLGRTHYVNGKFIASDLCLILTAKKEVNYLLYKNYFDLNRDDMVQKLATGTSKKAINQTNFSNYIIPYAGIEEQDNIYNILKEINLIEEKIECMKDENEKLCYYATKKLLNNN